MNFSSDITKVIDRIEKSQCEHLRHNLTQLIDDVSKTSTFNDAYIDASRAIKKILLDSRQEIELIEQHFNNEIDRPKQT